MNRKAEISDWTGNPGEVRAGNKKLTALLNLVFFILSILALFPAGAQNSEENAGLDARRTQQEVDAVEAELARARALRAEPRVRTEVKVDSVIDLAKLAPASDVSVIQKRLMPKTSRFQFFAGLQFLANDPWFSGQGLGLRLGYGFSEAWAVELQNLNLGVSSRDSVQDLSSSLAVNTSALVSTKNYLGAHLVWTPFFGKLALWDEKIVPFDMHFSLGGGSSGLTSASQSSAGTIHLGLGQVFSINKSVGLRWDLDVNTFNLDSGRFYNVVLGIGASYYIPEVRSR
ncbi:MAG: outer membrane beta-barrel domain-containing protein [Bdellovibrio sp.]